MFERGVRTKLAIKDQSKPHSLPEKNQMNEWRFPLRKQSFVCTNWAKNRTKSERQSSEISQQADKGIYAMHSMYSPISNSICVCVDDGSSDQGVNWPKVSKATGGE